MKVVKNATGYKCEVSLATNDLNVVQIPKIYISTVHFQYLYNCIYANYEPAD